MANNKTPQNAKAVSSTVLVDSEDRDAIGESILAPRPRAVDASVTVKTRRPQPSNRQLPSTLDVENVVPRQKGSPHRLVAAGGNRSPLYQTAKRGMDVVGSLTLILLASPVLIGTWILLRLTATTKPIFVQTRVGKCGRPFPCLKFRTMVENAESIKHLIENEKDGPIFKNRRDPRITGIGRILRTTSIDEAPQLFNVLMGHMSLVGPRPPIPDEVEDYTPKELTRLSVKPGLTCLWQVSGRSLIDFDNWMEMDIWYVENQSLKTDLSLLARTPLVVLSCRGAF